MRLLLFQFIIASWSATHWLASGCSIAGEWVRLSVEQRLAKFDIVVVGTDVEHVYNNATKELDSEFRVSCVLKNDGQEVGENITIYGVEPVSTCMVDVLTAGQDFIVGLERTATGYMQHLVNVIQETAFPNTTENLRIASTICGLQSPMQPKGALSMNYDFCQPQNYTEPCLSRSGKHGCGGGVVMATLSFAFILNLLFQ